MPKQEKDENFVENYASQANATPSDDDGNYVSITEASRINKVTRQAIYITIKLGKLRARKESTRWTINVNDLKAYRDEKYSRSKSTFNGELIFNNDKGYYSVNQVAQMLNIPAQKIYYATRIGYMKAQRKGSAWVIHSDDVEAYKKNYLGKKLVEAKAS